MNTDERSVAAFGRTLALVRRNRWASVPLAMAAAILLPACSGDTDIERGTERFWGSLSHGVLGHQSSNEESEIPVEGLVDVEVRNFAGDVIIRGDREDRRESAIVIFDRRGTHRGQRSEESEASLPEIRWNTELVPPTGPGLPSTLRITGETDHAEPWYQRLEIEVLVAQLGRVNVVTTNGTVRVSNNQGPFDIATSKGDVRVITHYPQRSESIAVTRDGDIDFRVRGESAFALDAETIGGEVTTRCEAGRWIALDARNDHDSMYTTLNNGQERIILRTVDGDIRVAVVGNPHDVGSQQIKP